MANWYDAWLAPSERHGQVSSRAARARYNKNSARRNAQDINGQKNNPATKKYNNEQAAKNAKSMYGTAEQNRKVIEDAFKSRKQVTKK